MDIPKHSEILLKHTIVRGFIIVDVNGEIPNIKAWYNVRTTPCFQNHFLTGGIEMCTYLFGDWKTGSCTCIRKGQTSNMSNLNHAFREWKLCKPPMEICINMYVNYRDIFSIQGHQVPEIEWESRHNIGTVRLIKL